MSGVRFSPSLNTDDRGDLDEICFEYGFTSRTDVIRQAVKLLNIACRAEKDGGRVIVANPKRPSVVCRVTP